MKKRIAFFVCLLLALSCLIGCEDKFKHPKLDVPEIKISSSSVNQAGKILTVCASSGFNEPAGQNKSPAVAWDAVEGAGFYIVMIFDENADWLHMLSKSLTSAGLKEGSFSDKDDYVGPYPPKSGGRHKYRIEVFALKYEPDKTDAVLDGVNKYSDIVTNINTAGNSGGNILARGHITGTYAYGDNNI